jgi:hypothetical protein
MTALMNFLALLAVSTVPVVILVAIRHFARKRGLDDRHRNDDPYQEPDYRKW